MFFWCGSAYLTESNRWSCNNSNHHTMFSLTNERPPADLFVLVVTSLIHTTTKRKIHPQLWIVAACPESWFNAIGDKTWTCHWQVVWRASRVHGVGDYRKVDPASRTPKPMAWEKSLVQALPCPNFNLRVIGILQKWSHRFKLSKLFRCSMFAWMLNEMTSKQL